MKKKSGTDKPFVGTPEHQALARAGITVITPTTTKEEVGKVLGSEEFEEALANYCGA